jgi:peroxiredoxin/GNAT superfamily N-acetyltransferase
MAGITVVPASEASWEDIREVFGTRGDPARCWCQRYKMAPGESWAAVGADELAHRFRTQTDWGDGAPGAAAAGLVAYLDGAPAGWCAVEPRTAYPRLLRNARVPWEGRDEDKDDDSVWAVTCFVIRTRGYRRRGVSRALVRAAVDHARDRGARALEGYPMIGAEGAIAGELHVGLRSAFAAAGFTEVARPGRRRVVMRIDFQGAEPMRKTGVMIEAGTTAPDFTLPDQDGNPVSLSDFRGRPVVLYFYPKAGTSGCTNQACGIRDHRADYERAGAVVLGVSPDPVSLVKKFADDESLDFRLLADEDHAVCDTYGVWAEKSMYGRTYWGALRATFIIDPEGTVATVFPKVSPKTHDDVVLKALDELGAAA